MMKQRNIWSGIAFLTLITAISSCDQSIDNLYEDKSRIQFKYYTRDFNQNMILDDRTTYSFGMKADDVLTDTAKIAVEFLGTPSDRDRTYRIRVVADSTTAVEGVHYAPIDPEQTFGAGRFTDTLRIVVFRDALSSSFTDPEDRRIALEMEPSGDFDLGMKDGLRTYLYINNYLSEPEWWSAPLRLNYIGFYHPEKWKILISFNELFANPQTVPFDINNQGRQYFQGLANYLNAVPTFDDETGDRIYIDRMVPQQN